ncbi:MAG: DUF1002 domain-containing protein [Peptococcaceae bacterium]|nr:DUF1002 domain-containing protein [Peptococcaceae bacterium]
MKKKIISAILAMGILASPMAAYADAAVGDEIVTIGTNLNQAQRQEVLSYFGAKDNAQIIDVDISEERQYLSGKVPDAQIGNSTNSCAMITYTTKGSGVNVTTHNINYVTPDAYKSAILTAGINDADVQITAPMEVSGTGALTGIMKAYEVSTGNTISEDVKQAATNELVTNAELGDAIGDDQANSLINGIKQQIADKKPQNSEEVKQIVDDALNQSGITLTDEQYQQLLDMIDQLSKLDINWDQLADNVSGLVDKASDYLKTDEGQNFLTKLQAIVNNFFDWIRGIFGGDANATDQSTDQSTQTTDNSDSGIGTKPDTATNQSTADSGTTDQSATTGGDAAYDSSADTSAQSTDNGSTDSGAVENTTDQSTTMTADQSTENTTTVAQ